MGNDTALVLMAYFKEIALDRSLDADELALYKEARDWILRQLS